MATGLSNGSGLSATGASLILRAPISGLGYQPLTDLITKEDITDSYWAKTGVTMPASNQMMETAVTSAHFIQAASSTGFPLPGAHGYRAAVDVAPVGGGRYFALGVNSFASESAIVQCDLQLGVVMIVTGGGWTSSSSILPLGGNTYRVSLTFTSLPSTTGLNYFLYMLGGSNVFSYAGNTSNGMTVTNITFYQTS